MEMKLQCCVSCYVDRVLIGQGLIPVALGLRTAAIENCHIHSRKEGVVACTEHRGCDRTGQNSERSRRWEKQDLVTTEESPVPGMTDSRCLLQSEPALRPQLLPPMLGFCFLLSYHTCLLELCSQLASLVGFKLHECGDHICCVYL